MLSFLTDLKRRLFPLGPGRSMRRGMDRILCRTSRQRLGRALAGLGIPRDSLVCVHSRLSALGHLVGGPEMVIDAVQDAVPGCTLMVPTFAFGGTCVDYLSTGQVFDPSQTPSVAGALTTALWQRPGARRSHHPTHACAALGERAGELIDGSEQSPTPFGEDSTYGRFAKGEDSWLLLIHTNNTSLVHRFQEVAGMPNLFLPGTSAARALAADGEVRSYQVKVHRPKLPLFVVMGGGAGGEQGLDHVWLPDYCLQRPAPDRRRIQAGLRSPESWQFLAQRQAWFRSQGILRSVRLGRAELMAIAVAPYQERICSDLRASIEAHRADYSFESLERAAAAGLLQKHG